MFCEHEYEEFEYNEDKTELIVEPCYIAVWMTSPFESESTHISLSSAGQENVLIGSFAKQLRLTEVCEKDEEEPLRFVSFKTAEGLISMNPIGRRTVRRKTAKMARTLRY